MSSWPPGQDREGVGCLASAAADAGRTGSIFSFAPYASPAAYPASSNSAGGVPSQPQHTGYVPAPQATIVETEHGDNSYHTSRKRGRPLGSKNKPHVGPPKSRKGRSHDDDWSQGRFSLRPNISMVCLAAIDKRTGLATRGPPPTSPPTSPCASSAPRPAPRSPQPLPRLRDGASARERALGAGEEGAARVRGLPVRRRVDARRRLHRRRGLPPGHAAAGLGWHQPGGRHHGVGRGAPLVRPPAHRRTHARPPRPPPRAARRAPR